MNTILCNTVTPEQAYKLNPSLPFWLSPAWMNSLAALHKITPQVLVCSKNDNPAAFLPSYIKSFITLKKAYNPTLSYYSPLAFALPDRKQPNRELLLEYEITKAMGDFLHRNFQRVMLNLSPELYDIRGFKDAGLKVSPQYTFIRDLTVKTDFFSSEMKKLRSAEKEGFAFNSEFNPKRLLELVFGMYHRKRHPFPFDQDALLELLLKLHKAGLAEQYNVVKDDKIVSSIVILPGKEKICYGWLTASDTQFMQKGASLYLYRELFKVLADRFDAFDMCGANSRGPSRLKAALGAELKLFFQISK